MVKIIKKNKFLNGINKNLSSWRLTENSLSSSIKQRLMDSFKLYYNYEKYNIIFSIFFVLRLTCFAVLKKIKIYLIRN
jgi:teichuronic acid biosynthesis glycosyltransferase TuaG